MERKYQQPALTGCRQGVLDDDGELPCERTLQRLGANAVLGDRDRRGRPQPDADAELLEQHERRYGDGLYTFAGDANHTGSSDSKNFTIGQAARPRP